MDLPAILFAIAILLATCLSCLAYIPPNPNPSGPKAKDRASILTSSLFLLPWLATTTSIGAYHSYLVLFPPTISTILCTYHDRLNPSLFTWNLHTILCLVCILIFASLRLLSFTHLGPNFTYRIAPPKKLITTGIYHYVQHPSYTALIGVVVANGLLLDRPDGIPACWLGNTWIESHAWMIIGSGVVVGMGLLMIRIRDEEQMLEDSFGKEWEVWHAKTARFIPGVFEWL
ncbi:hypothetical protein LHYA1_G004640 [Lachnellula hyalina]|uniref:Protein-S-isoprenylcysteine O-methyltransferase n=1 Tax=Lachnellula hyalina TaxID=1316788 RepID=A0A8H8TXM3_9HELO|nr:uncharacterized protein LHYA1_G004640 [Lachnellula hyalina]TVY25662.1 hypothetical protein LHYA1_G004640 [Lachnellula hyalina]